MHRLDVSRISGDDPVCALFHRLDPCGKCRAYRRNILALRLRELALDHAHRLDHFLRRGPALARHFAPDQVVRLDRGGALVNGGNARIAQQLRRAGFLDIAHAAVHLDAGRGHFDAVLGAPALHHRDHHVGKRLVLGPQPCVRVAVGDVHRGRGHIRQRAHRLGLRLHAHQHAPHIGLADDGHRLGAAGEITPLHPLLGVAERQLVGALRYGDALQADGEARGVHHDEHVGEAFVLLTHQIADRAFLLAVDQHRGGAGVDAELVLDRSALHVVPLAQAAVGIDQELGHDEQRYALHPLGCVGRAREHQVNDVLGQVVLAVSNENLLAGDAVVIAFALGLRLDQRQIRACLRLGQVHGAGPGAFDHFRQEGLFEPVGAAQEQRLDRAAGQQRAQRKRQIGRFPHLHHRRRHQLGQALTAEFGRELQGVPAAFDELFVRGDEAFRCRDAALVPLRPLRVTGLVQRRQHFAAEFPALLQNLLDQIDTDVLAARQSCNLIQSGEFIQHELHVFQRRDVITHDGL